MKRYLYVMLAVISGVMTSCASRDEQGPQEGEITTLQVQLEGVAPGSRALEGVRYVASAFDDNGPDFSAPSNVFEGGTTSVAISNDGHFDMLLNRHRDYHFAIWADIGGNDVYDLDLPTVTLKAGKNPVESWAERIFGVDYAQKTLTATLRRAVSKIKLMETGRMPSGTSVELKFKHPNSINLVNDNLTLGPVEDEVDFTETYTLTSDVSGTVAAPAQLNTKEIYVFSTRVDNNLLDLDFKISVPGDAPFAFSVSNVPRKNNHVTNIKGHYGSEESRFFDVDCTNEWGTGDNIYPPFAAVGHYVYNDKTCRSEYINDAANPCIGVVTWVDPSNERKVKILSLHAKGVGYIAISTGIEYIGRVDDNDGWGNTEYVVNHAKYIATPSNYPAVQWCKSLTTAGLSWYLPSINELMPIIDDVVEQAFIRGGGGSGYGVYSSSSSNQEVNADKAINTDLKNITTGGRSSYAMAVVELDDLPEDRPVSGLGWFVYSDKTCSRAYKQDAANPCVGIICWINPENPKNVKVISVQVVINSFASSPGPQMIDVPGSHSVSDGLNNTKAIVESMEYVSSPDGYPAIQWIKNLTDGGLNWYMPARDELLYFAANKNVINNGLYSIGADLGLSGDAQSSTYEGDGTARYVVNYTDGSVVLATGYDPYHVHGVAYVDILDKPEAPTTSVGWFLWTDGSCTKDYSPSLTLAGVVFWVDPNNAKNVKVMSADMTKATYGSNSVFVGAESESDGAANTLLITGREDYSESAFPAAWWCAHKTGQSGAQWYIPAIKELEIIYAAKDVINVALTQAGATVMDDEFHMSSTEEDAYGIKVVNPDGAAVYTKYMSAAVRAVVQCNIP